MPQAIPEAAAPQRVEGHKLEQITVQTERNWSWAWMVLLIVAAMAAGFLGQSIAAPKRGLNLLARN